MSCDFDECFCDHCPFLCTQRHLNKELAAFRCFQQEGKQLKYTEHLPSLNKRGSANLEFSRLVDGSGRGWPRWLLLVWKRPDFMDGEPAFPLVKLRLRGGREGREGAVWGVRSRVCPRRVARVLGSPLACLGAVLWSPVMTPGPSPSTGQYSGSGGVAGTISHSSWSTHRPWGSPGALRELQR